MFKNFELLQIGDPMLKLRAKEVDIEALKEGKQDALLKIMRMAHLARLNAGIFLMHLRMQLL